MKRILLFLATNLAVILVLSVVARLTGLDRWLALNGSSYSGLLVMATLFGFGGALISLAMSKWMAKRAMGVRVITQPANANEQWLVNSVRALASQAGIGVPEVGVFDSPQPNAFATGARRDAALVAVSTGLLQTMGRSEVEAVLGHEITHVANGDMVTLTLIQGVVNTFVIFLARVIGSIVDRALSGNREGRGGIGYFVTVMAAQLVLGILASVIVMWFSRRREFRADAGGARLAGRNNMIGALERLKASHGPALPAQLAAFGIGGGGGMGLQKLFMSHPPIEERIAALRSQV
ncbi:MAG TPA: protease HtpX [Steroidobacteraceae bacterium]|nr:protease HtpX [Steroidobacteraceae bacterium]